MSVLQKELPHFALTPLRPASIFTTVEAWHKVLVVAIVVLAIGLRLYGISIYSLQGDENGSILEARWLGLNWNSIIYSTVLHFWIRAGSSELWLRLPAAVIGIATVPVLFKVGARLGGWRTGAAAAVLAATSPFNIYHSQEVRFYSFFMFAAAAFMLATTSYVDSRKSIQDRLLVIITGMVLAASHFLGLIALYAQGAAAFLAGSRRRLKSVLAITICLPILVFGFPLIPVIRDELLRMYQIWGNGWGADLSATRLSLLSPVKLAFAGYVLIFGYHVYPLRLVVVVPAVTLCAFLLVRGIRRLARSRWIALPLIYFVAVGGIYLVLDPIAGRVATGVSPRHVAFVWPAFIILLSLGLTSLTKRKFQILLTAVLAINLISLWFGWQRDWTYGVATDYRAAGAYVASWADKDSAMIVDSRAYEALDQYFPRLPLASRPGSAEYDQADYKRLIVVTNDWRSEPRRETNELLSALVDKFTVIDGRVDYPLFEYVFERKPAAANFAYAVTDNGQVALSPRIYPMEFADLKLPINASVASVPLKVTGASVIPNDQDGSRMVFPLVHPTRARRAVLLTNFVGSDGTLPDEQVANLIVEDKAGATSTFPVRLNHETALWSQRCAPAAECQTVFQWHKRIAIAGQNSFPDARRDFSAGMHGVVLNLPHSTEVVRISLHYLAGSGHLYVWSIALAS